MGAAMSKALDDALDAVAKMAPQDNEPPKKERCPTCGRSVNSIFDHIDQNCEAWGDRSNDAAEIRAERAGRESVASERGRLLEENAHLHQECEELTEQLWTANKHKADMADALKDCDWLLRNLHAQTNNAEAQGKITECANTIHAALAKAAVS
jgi:hypothetical protein